MQPNLGALSDGLQSNRQYEDLQGGRGREIFHRLERTDIASLLQGCHDLLHEVSFDGCSGELINYGLNGLAFTLSADFAIAENDLLDEIHVRVGDEVVYRGAAMVRYTHRQASLRVVGVVLLDGILDLDRILSAKARSIANSAIIAISRACRTGISAAYKQAVSDAVFLMNSYRALLDEQEQNLANTTVGEMRARGELESLGAAEHGFREHYDNLRQLLNCQSLEIPHDNREAYKRYTEAMLHPAILCAPAAYRCYSKPFGYPGDYVLMSYLYSDERFGDSLYAKLIHQVVVREEPLANAVRHRKDFMLSLIRTVANSKNRESRKARVLSLGCGPAQEVVEFLRTGDAPEIGLTLVDQDQRSLAHVNWTLSKLLVPRRAPMPAQYLHIGFKQLLAYGDVLDAIQQQDLIYTAGLFDYLSPRIAQRLAARLFEKLRPGGVLAIGNFKRPNDATWSLEYWMDWPLIYRTKDEVLDIAGSIDRSYDREVATDGSGYTHVLLVHKK